MTTVDNVVQAISRPSREFPGAVTLLTLLRLWIHQLFLPAVVVHRLKSPHTSHKGLTLSCQVKNLLLLGVDLSISQRLAEICCFSALEDDLMVVTGGSPRAALERAAPNSARQRRLKEC